MKKTVPFDLFGPNQFLKFDVLGLADLETALGQSIPVIMKSGNAGVNFCLKALPIALRHHYHKQSPEFFANKIGEYLQAGGSLDDIALPIIRAIAATGIFGKVAEAELNGDAAPEDDNEKNG